VNIPGRPAEAGAAIRLTTQCKLASCHLALLISHGLLQSKLSRRFRWCRRLGGFGHFLLRWQQHSLYNIPVHVSDFNRTIPGQKNFVLRIIFVAWQQAFLGQILHIKNMLTRRHRNPD